MCALACALAMTLAASASTARADEAATAVPAGPAAPAAPAPSPSAAPISATAIDLEKDTQSAALSDVPGPPAEAPPPPPYKKSVVIDASLGALVFLGRFGETAPPAPWIRAQVGYEIFQWLMVFGEGELGFSDTSGTQAPPRTRAFPLFGFGGGARFTARFTERFGAFVQGSIGALKADIRRRSLEIIGYRDAEDLGVTFGGRLGVEWYQMNRHFALGANAGLRNATGFARVGSSDTPLAFDAGASIRYAF